MYCSAAVAAVVEVAVDDFAEVLPKHLDPSVDSPIQLEATVSESAQSAEVVRTK